MSKFVKGLFKDFSQANMNDTKGALPVSLGWVIFPIRVLLFVFFVCLFFFSFRKCWRGGKTTVSSGN